MEGRLQGPINPCFLEEEEEKDIEEHLDVEMEWLEQETSNNITKLGFGSPSERSFVEMRIPFLEMLQSGDSPALSPFCELSFQALLSLQQFKKPPCEESHSHHHHHQYPPELRECGGGSRFKEQQDSCLTHDAVEVQISPVKSETMDHHNTRSAIYVEGGGGNQHDASKAVELEERPVEAAAGKGPQKRKRVKRTRASAKNKEEVESQRMTHIAVERNRRRQMNDHLTALRSLMPSSYIQRGDQASIVGGAIDYVKELEQLHQSLQAQKRMKKSDLLDQSGGRSGSSSEITTSTSTSSSSTATTGILATSSPQTSQFGNTRFEMGELGNGTTTRTTEGINIRRSYEFTAVKKSGGVEVHVTVIQNHVSLKVECPRKAGVLLNAIVALEDLGLTVLHLNIMALENSAHYSFNLKIEEGCEIGSADGIAVVVHQIFCFIHRTT